METKKCSQCNEIKSLTEFYPTKRYSMGVTGICRKCSQINRSRNYYKNPDKYKKKHKDWREKTPKLSEKRRIRTYIKYLEKKGYKITNETSRIL